MTANSGQQQTGPTANWNRVALVIMGAGVASLAAAAVLFILILTGSIGTSGYSGPETISGTVGDIRSVLTPQPTPTVPRPPPSEAPVTRIAIPRFGVDAPIVVRGVDAQGVMETPDGPKDVAWYDFSARPGFGSNAVFSGHVDYINYGAAVFWNLKDLEMNDIIEVRLEDGTVYEYVVVAKDQVNAATAPIQEIVGSTPQEVVTLITCGGAFDASVGQYDERVIVRAVRIFEDTPAPVDGAAVLP